MVDPTNQPIVIVGGGPVGGVLALALQQNNITFTMLEARSRGASYKDTRALALSHGSRLILEKLGVWSLAESYATPIHTIHISQRGGLGRSKLSAGEHDLPALGYVLPYGALMRALDEGIDMKHVRYEAKVKAVRASEKAAEVVLDQEETLTAALVVVADGGHSLGEMPGIERETKSYGHDALVTRVRTELPHCNIAYERFTPQGPIALLPNGQDSHSQDFNLVWTGLQANIQAVFDLPDDEFLRQLHTAFGDRVGDFLSVEKRITFPLRLSRLKPATTSHLVVIGNAAQTMHPVAGQGLNVGLRDAWTLADLIMQTEPAHLGESDMLVAYQQKRGRDVKGGLLFTDLLVNLFSNDHVGLSFMRGAGLGMLEILRPAKSLLVRKMSFGK